MLLVASYKFGPGDSWHPLFTVRVSIDLLRDGFLGFSGGRAGAYFDVQLTNCFS
jgi:hypothetical protein